jgi:hypothetical protein
MVFTISEERAGWFVDGTTPIGPFISKQRALDLADGMVSALMASGEDAEVVVADNPNLAAQLTPRWNLFERTM